MSDRAQQIAQTSIRVRPLEIGSWVMVGPGRLGPADGMIVAPADLAWLLETARRVREVVDEATGHTFRRSRFMPIDSAFTNALYEALGGAPWEASPEHDGDDYRGADAD